MSNVVMINTLTEDLSPPGRGQTAQVRHSDVHQNHVGTQRPGQVDRPIPIRRLADDLDIELADRQVLKAEHIRG